MSKNILKMYLIPIQWVIIAALSGLLVVSTIVERKRSVEGYFPLNERIREARKQGYSDTQILDYISQAFECERWKIKEFQN